MLKRLILIGNLFSILFSKILIFFGYKYDESVIPEGAYCYTPKRDSNTKLSYAIEPCPYYKDISMYFAGCKFLGNFYTDLEFFDQCKMCDINYGLEEMDRCKYFSLEESLEAVKRDGMNLEYCHDPEHEVCMAAIKQNVKAIQFIKDPNERLMVKVIIKRILNGENF